MACRAADLGPMPCWSTPRPPFADRPDRDSLILDYHARIAEAGLPLVLFYLYEAAGGISYPPGLCWPNYWLGPRSWASRSPPSTA